MSDEIKEILIKDFNEILVKEFCTDWKEKRLYIELLVNSTPFSNLLDYITNLQEKLEVAQDNEESYRLEMQDITKCLGLDEHTLFDDVKDYATNLQQENQRLKEQINDNKVIIEYAIKPSFTTRKLQDYKSRVEKAVEYIKENAKYQKATINNNKYYSEYLINQVLDILNGRSDE